MDIAQGMSKIYEVTGKEKGGKPGKRTPFPPPKKKSHIANVLGGLQIR